jgi:tape measure domain-containing protein
MSTKKLEWLFGLEDHMSGPASAAEKKLELLERRIKSVAKAEAAISGPRKEKLTFARLGLEIQRDQLRGSMKGAEEATSGWIAKLDHGLGIVQKIGGVVWEVAKGIGHWGLAIAEFAVHSAAAKEKQFLSYRTLLGSGAGARSMLADMEALSDRTPFGAEQMTGWGRRLLAGGFKQHEIPTLLRAMSDSAAATGAGPEKVDEAVGALRRINTEGRLSERTLRALSAVGVPVGAVYQRLASALGVTAERARALVKAGKVDSSNALWAIVGGVSDKRSKGVLGSAGETAVEESGAILLEKVGARWNRYFDDLYETKGFGAFKGFLRNVLGALDTSSATGKRIAESIGGAFDRIFTGLFGSLSGPDGLRGVERIVDKISTGIDVAGFAIKGLGAGLSESLTPALESLGLAFEGPLDPARATQIEENFRALGKTIGHVVERVAQLVGKLDDLLSMGDDQAMLSKQLGETKLDTWSGRADALGVKRLKDAGGPVSMAGAFDWALMFEDYARAAFSSPEEIGREVGFPMPAPQPSVTAHDLAKGAGARVFSPTVENHIHVEGAAAADPEAIGEAAGDATTDALSTWEDASMALGATDE